MPDRDDKEWRDLFRDQGWPEPPPGAVTDAQFTARRDLWVRVDGQWFFSREAARAWQPGVYGPPGWNETTSKAKRNRGKPTKKNPRAPPAQIAEALPALVAKAQEVYDAWEQDEEGFDEELGSGGICQDIAAELAGELSSRGIDASTVSALIGEQHVWVVAKIEDGKDAGVWLIDIPPHVYEHGSGYSWRKIPDVRFEPGDIVVSQESPNPDDFERFMED